MDYFGGWEDGSNFPRRMMKEEEDRGEGRAKNKVKEEGNRKKEKVGRGDNNGL